MRLQTYLVAAAAACLLIAPAANARSHHAHAKRTQIVERPTSVALLDAMVDAADEWWTLEGSPPPCAGHADVAWGIVGLYSEWAFYDSCTMMLSPHWWATQYAYLTGSARVGLRRRAAAFDLALLMHARGHNIGYRHIPGTVMQENTPVVPGWAFGWATRMIR